MWPSEVSPSVLQLERQHEHQSDVVKRWHPAVALLFGARFKPRASWNEARLQRVGADLLRRSARVVSRRAKCADAVAWQARSG
jgi:hypothetical protein